MSLKVTSHVSGKFKRCSEIPSNDTLTGSHRLVLYFPVSALVTLFGNILQNPLEPRAKSDVKQMDLVVTFLSMLGQEAEQGGVHRMLGVCSEFCRIAKNVIEKADREQSSRRKRKAADTPGSTEGRNQSLPPSATTAAALAKSPTPASSSTQDTPKSSSTSAATTPQAPVHDTLSPDFIAARASFQNAVNKTPSGLSPSADSMQWSQDFQLGRDMDFDTFGDLAGLSSDIQSPPLPGSGTFQQPLLPPDLYSMTMGLDWNWVEMSGGAYPTVENGNFGNLENTGVIDPRQQM